MEKKLLTIKELARLLNYSEQTIRNYVKKGMPVIQLQKGSPMRFDLDEVMKWMRGARE